MEDLSFKNLIHRNATLTNTFTQNFSMFSLVSFSIFASRVLIKFRNLVQSILFGLTKFNLTCKLVAVGCFLNAKHHKSQ